MGGDSPIKYNIHEEVLKSFRSVSLTKSDQDFLFIYLVVVGEGIACGAENFSANSLCACVRVLSPFVSFASLFFPK